MRLTAEGCAARRQELVRAAACDLLLITNPRHILYLCGVYVTQLALSGWGLNCLMIDARSGKTTLVAHNFIDAAARTAYADDVQIWTWYDAARRSGGDLFGQAVQEINARIQPYAGKRVGVEIGWLPFGVQVANPVNINPMLLAMRRKKYPDELAMIREAVRVVEAGHRAARGMIRPGLTELDVYNAIQAAMVTEAGHAVHLMGDFVSGEYAARVGGVATPRVLQAGDLMILDLFPIVNGYRADFTATLSVDGTFSESQKNLQAGVHAAIEAGEGMLKAGNRAADVYQALRRALAQYQLAEGFTHHGGHGLGLDHPEAPYFVPESEEVLMAGDVVTLEPGSYGGGTGARIERNYLITDSGFERLTHHAITFA